ncbi:MAG: acyltransferase [Alphaproteobacteria bacterium]|nr:acyltransferase [Alphaproteobacteria bacterium]
MIAESQLTKKTSFMVLQVWRALAAFIVMAGHANNEAMNIAKNTDMFYPFSRYPSGVGVDIFFVISGFVIVYASRNLIGRAGRWRGFMCRRLIRIVPLYWFYTSLMLGIAFILPQVFDTARPEFWHLVQSYFFIPHVRPFGDAVRPYLALGWSLNYEMYFYVIFAALMCLPLNRMMGALLLFLISSVLIGLSLPPGAMPLKFWFDPYVLEFLSGALLAYVFLRGWRLPKAAFWPMVALGFGGLVYIVIPESYSVEGQLLRFFISILFVAAAVLPRGVEDMAPPKILVALGDSSYSLYLSHPFAMGAVQLVCMKLGAPLPLFVVLTIIAALIAGHVSYLMIERPVQKFLLNRLEREK